jgi:hypothetical protein
MGCLPAEGGAFSPQDNLADQEERVEVSLLPASILVPVTVRLPHLMGLD